jgi:UDPglucose 6-dehydrogenase
MSRVGFVGCGKLGLMVALTVESCGHAVKGYDICPDVDGYLKNRFIPFQEEHSAALLATTQMEMVSLSELCKWADILFLAPQTPHLPRFEGTTPLPDDRADFDYSFLKNSVTDVSWNLVRPTPCVVISTVLPGTMEREIIPLLGPNFELVYSPQFIAMGTVYEDFLHPEFWLIGSRHSKPAKTLKRFYETISSAPSVTTDIRTAEGIKVFYNTFITTKTVLANLYGEMAQRMNMKVDDIVKAITLSTRRLLSPKYLQAGMGDGGGCHPRDNIALSWLSDELGMRFNFFDSLMIAREKHCEWLADVIEEYRNGELVVILGRSFKPETNIETGSPALLLAEILRRREVPYICAEDCKSASCFKNLYFIGTKHARYAAMKFQKGSVVIDPFRYIPEQEGVTIIRIGEGKKVAVPVTA